MARVKFQSQSEEWYMFQDFWKLCQEFWIAETNEKYWIDLVDAVQEYTKKYSYNDFAIKIAIAFLNSREEIRRKEK